jgi:Mn2+/Fe2+ NRAMP family transporter
MAATAASLPVSVLPLLVLLNDRQLMGRHVNRPLGNLALGLITVLSVVLLLVSFPLAFLGG